MIIIGEKLNSSVPATKRAFEAGDEKYFAETARRQTECGAAFLDVNAGMFADEADKLLWAVNIAKKFGHVSVDSVNPDVVKFVLENAALDRPLINSVTLDDARFDGISPLLEKFGASVVALPIGATMPKSAAERVSFAETLIGRLRGVGTADENVFVDVLIEAASVEWESAKESLSAARTLREKFPNVHLTCGLSNVSFGMPKRFYINNALISAAVTSGVDSAILDITRDDVRMTIKAAELLAGLDEFGMEYITEYRELFDE